MKTIMGKTFYSSLIAFSILFTACGETSSDTTSEYLPNSTKMTLVDSVQGTINETEDHTEESYKLAISETGKYSINLKLLDGSTYGDTDNIWAVVYDENGNELIKLDDYWVDNVNDFYASREFDVLTTGNIYVKIGRDANLPTKYDFNISK